MTDPDLVTELAAHIGAYDVEPGSPAAEAIAQALLDGPLADPTIVARLPGAQPKRPHACGYCGATYEKRTGDTTPCCRARWDDAPD
jgi:hypothetical protein